jgi:glycosyltransferase involved in cell wall biosynthesis
MNHSTKLLCLIPSLSSGGAERQMSYLLKFLNEAGHTPTVITYYNTKDYDCELKMNRIRIKGWSIIRYFRIIRAIKQQKPNTILAYGETPNILIIFSSLFCKKVKVVVSERNTSLHYDIWTRIRLNLYRFSTTVVVNSQSQTDFIIQNAPFLISKIKTITNYTDVQRFNFQLKIKEPVTKIGILARFHPQKNIVRFLEAVKILNAEFTNKVEYYWYGRKSKYYVQCEEIRRNDFLNNVYFNDFAENESSVLSEMDVICLPSLYEGFSNTLSEAICAGKPILASEVCDNPVFVKEGENGFLFNPYSVEDIVKAISKFLALSQDELFEFQKQSRLLAENLFSKEKFVQSYFEVLF